MLPIALVTALISAGGLVLGSVIGAICSIFINKVSLHEQVRIQRENLNYQENCNAKEKYINANIIRLDFCNAIYQSVRVLQNMDNYEVSYSIPMYKDYHKIIATLCDEYSLKELSYIYQFYGILEINSKKKGYKPFVRPVNYIFDNQEMAKSAGKAWEHDERKRKKK